MTKHTDDEMCREYEDGQEAGRTAGLEEAAKLVDNLHQAYDGGTDDDQIIADELADLAARVRALAEKVPT